MRMIMKIIIIISALFVSFFVQAKLQPMSEDAMSSTYGQAIFEIKETKNVDQGAGRVSLDMLKLTIGARIEINANVAEVSVGRYWRPEGTNCSGGSDGNKICFNGAASSKPGNTSNPSRDGSDYYKNLSWACTAKPCGSVGLYERKGAFDPSNKVYESSTLTHAGTALNGLSPKHFFDFPGGFEPDNGVDIKLRDITMGQIRDIGGGRYEMTPFVQENPYFEFAFDNTGGARKLVGFRLGAENSFGYQGNVIDVLSGFIRPNIDVDAKLGSLPLGRITMSADLGGVRTVGWLDPRGIYDLKVDGIASLLINGRDALVGMSKTPQLYPVQSNYLKNSSGFFISMGIRPIQWTKHTPNGANPNGFTPSLTAPGFWLNMGGDGGLRATTKQGDHPKNYFPGHPNFAKYQSSTNFNKDQPSWSSTYKN